MTKGPLLPLMNGDHAEFEAEWSGKDPKTRPDWPLPSADGMDWAEAFLKITTIVGKDGQPIEDQTGVMLGWFCNAIERGRVAGALHVRIQNQRLPLYESLTNLLTEKKQGYLAEASKVLDQLLRLDALETDFAAGSVSDQHGAAAP